MEKTVETAKKTLIPGSLCADWSRPRHGLAGKRSTGGPVIPRPKAERISCGGRCPVGAGHDVAKAGHDRKARNLFCSRRLFLPA